MFLKSAVPLYRVLRSSRSERSRLVLFSCDDCPFRFIVLDSSNIALLITAFIKEESPLLPDPCHFQDYDRSIFRLACIRGMLPEDVR